MQIKKITNPNQEKNIDPTSKEIKKDKNKIQTPKEIGLLLLKAVLQPQHMVIVTK